MAETEEKKRPLMQRLSEDASSVIAELIYEKVNSLLGAGDQLFTMEFPARPLDQNTYKYDTAPIVQSGNGEKLSVVYSNLLNYYVPKMDFLKDFVMDKNYLREWLLTEVSDVVFDENHKVVSTDTKISRMELCKKLYGMYFEERNKWYKEKNERFNQSKNSENLLEEYAKWVSSEGLVRDEELNNFFNDVVVRGNYHELMTILGFLNVESPAETLEKTKQNMRVCEKRAINGSGSVYPVQLQPNDWFKALEPNLHPKDLTMSSEALMAEFRAKKKELKSLEQKLAELEQDEISPDEMEASFNKVCELTTAVEDAVSAQMEYATPSGDTPSSEAEEAQTLLLPENSGDASDSGFMDVILTSEAIQKKSEESSSSSHDVASSEDSSKIEIGFRVMKVSIERGQWFAPNIFKMTQNFYHLSKSRCAPGINKDDIRNVISKTDADAQLKKMLSYTVDNKQCNYMFPSYPAAFVIAKEITIRVKISQEEISENISYVESQNSTSGGFFGFSASSAGNSKNCSESSYVGVRNNVIYIRIPGPQILGWFQQLVPLDVSEKYMPMEGNPYETVLKKLNLSKEE